MLNMRAHRSGSRILVDMQPTMIAASASSMPAINTVLETFMGAATRNALAALAADGLRSISGFDRVMVYRFGSKGEGEIVAESKIEELGSLLGMTYPAADIPPQARALFLRNRVSAIADTSYVPVPVLAEAASVDGEPIDMTWSTLRGISPIHCEYLRNMKVAATLTISIVHRDALLGMIVCHHNTPRVTGPELRSIATLLGQVISLLVGSMSESEAYVARLSHQNSLQTIVEAIACGTSLAEGLTSSSEALLALVDARGAIVRLSGKTTSMGELPPAEVQFAALALLDQSQNAEIFGIDDFGAQAVEHDDRAAAGSGALFLPLGLGSDDAIIWFRPELRRNITWGGDPAHHHSVDAVTGRLTPRASFEAWNETTRGQSAPWTDADIALAADFRVAIETEVAARASAGLARLRHYDPLTGLSNRRRLEERLVELSELGPLVPQIGVLFLDLDRFKLVNDSMGHAAGDLLLVQMTERLLAVTGPTHFSARLGGDEFVVLTVGLKIADVSVLAEGIRRTLEQPFCLAERIAHLSVSIGIAMAGEIGALDILQAADMAMYEAKQNGGNRAAVFEQSLHDHAVRKFELDHDLREAVNETEQLMLVYQPLCDLHAEGHPVLGFEALLRWRHPRLGWVAPDMFIPIAERSGLIVKLGDWILVTAIRQAKAMRDANPGSNLLMTINISVLQLAEPGFCARLASLLEHAILPPAAICLEVTESMISDKAIASVLRDVRSLGVKIAIDDFGTGYSSLSYLRRLPADIVKLDISFLDETEVAGRDTDFVGAIVALIHAAGMIVIQEGVETLSQCTTAQDAGADMVQGFMFGRPLLPPDAMKLARNAGVATALLGPTVIAAPVPRAAAIVPPVVH
jgi:diguanylate cyclase (GGDEF)-like protein